MDKYSLKIIQSWWMKCLLCLMIFYGFLLSSCKHDPEIKRINNEELLIHLKWNQAYADETQAKVETGLLWVFCFLGASLPEGSFQQARHWDDESHLTIDFSRLGFNTTALEAFRKIFLVIKQSEEYKVSGAVDLGRFIMLTLNSSRHYYAITGVFNKYSDLKLNRKSDSIKAAIIESTVSLTNRMIELPDSNLASVFNTYFIAHECDGSIPDGTQKEYEYETTELMPNGQFRFAIYQTDETLINASNTDKTLSGKPAKCLWCHEINLLPSFMAKTNVPGYYSPYFFKYLIGKNMNWVNQYRSTLKSDIDYTKKQDHTYAELLYISFMEPSACRLSKEWHVSVEEVKKIMSNCITHVNQEFTYLDTLYTRVDADLRAPFRGLKVPESAREESNYEPDFLK